MFNFSLWLSAPLHVRVKIANVFGIVKKGPTHVADNVVKEDGYIYKDIESALTLAAIQKYLGTGETDIRILWTQLVDKVEGRTVFIPAKADVKGPMSVLPPEDVDKFNKEYEERNPGKVAPVPEVAEVLKKKPGRPKKTTL